MNYQLSILIPSAYPDKLEKVIKNLRETISDWSQVEIVVCRDGNRPTHRDGNIVNCYSPPSKFRSTFHEKPWLESSGRFLLMMNDDVEFITKGWDRLIPYNEYPDDLVLFHFKDNHFNQNFACHPIFSRKMMNLAPGILSPLFQVTKCDNTIWDIHPAQRRIYLPEIEIVHHHENYDKSWDQAHLEDNIEYSKHQEFRFEVKRKICELIKMEAKVLISVSTAEMARRAEFYDYFNLIERPPGSVCMNVHGSSIAANRNQHIYRALQYGCTHIFFLDDDVICKPNIVYKLLSHDKDIVTGLQLARNFPHLPYLFNERMPNGKYKYYELNNTDEGLIPIKAAGAGCLLVNTDVFKRMMSPWFRLGQIEADQLGEDLDFFTRAEKQGFEAFCDLDCAVGHAISAIIWPVKVKENWYISQDTNGTGVLNFLHSEQKKAELV